MRVINVIRLGEFESEDNTPTVSPKYIRTTETTYDEYKVNETIDSVPPYKKFLFKNLLNGDYIIYAQMLNDSYDIMRTLQSKQMI